MNDRAYHFVVETMRTGYVIHRTEGDRIVETIHGITQYDVARNILEMLRDAEKFRRLPERKKTKKQS